MIPFYTKNNFKSNNITAKFTHFYTFLKHTHDDDMQVDPSDITTSTRK